MLTLTLSSVPTPDSDAGSATAGTIDQPDGS